MEFIIEFKTPVSGKIAGEQLKFNVDQIELGRDSGCQVQFDESFSTVSRKHAVIVRDGDRFKIENKSQLNSTYVNGKPVKDAFYLSNGDEIKLSSQGPVAIFKMPNATVSQNMQTQRTSTNKTTVNALGGNPSPKKNYLPWILAALVVVLACVALFLFNNKETEKEIVPVEVIKDFASIDECYNAVYYIKLNQISVYDRNMNEVITFNTEDKIGGTGFMLADGQFVTARRVIEPWFYYKGGVVGNDKNNNVWSYDDLQGLYKNGFNIVVSCTAYSPAGTNFQFRNTDFKKSERTVFDKATDNYLWEPKKFVSRYLAKMKDVKKNLSWLTTNLQDDWATMAKVDQLNTVKGLVVNKQWGNKPKYGTECVLIGYPMKSNGVSQDIAPVSSPNAINVSELNIDHVIELSSRRWVEGYDGAPALFFNDGQWTVFGILSSSPNFDRDLVMPIGNIY